LITALQVLTGTLNLSETHSVYMQCKGSFAETCAELGQNVHQTEHLDARASKEFIIVMHLLSTFGKGQQS